MLHPVRTKHHTSTEERKINSAKAKLEKSFTREAVSRVCRGRDWRQEHPRQRPEQRQDVSRERSPTWPKLGKQEQGCWGVRLGCEVFQGSLGCIIKAIASHQRSQDNPRWRQTVD